VNKYNIEIQGMAISHGWAEILRPVSPASRRLLYWGWIN
jgi:hypothetical protein